MTVLKDPRITKSMMQTFLTCQYKCYLKYELRLRTLIPGKALRIGIAVHEGIHAFFTAYSAPGAKMGPDTWMNFRSAGTSAAVKKYDDEWRESGVFSDPYQWEIERQIVYVMVDTYIWRWAQSHHMYFCMASEQPFSAAMRYPGKTHKIKSVVCAGVFDRILAYNSGRIDEKIDEKTGEKAVEVILHELKTTSEDIEDGSEYWLRLRGDLQIYYYVLALRRSKLKKKPTWVLYDVLRKPTIKPTKVPVLDAGGDKVVLDAQGLRVFTKQKKPRQSADKEQGFVLQTRPETPSEFGQRVVDCMTSEPDKFFNRHEVVLPHDQVDAIEKEIYQILVAIRSARQRGVWLKNRGQCLTVFGKCPYFDMCSTFWQPENEIPEGLEQIESAHPEIDRIPKVDGRKKRRVVK